MATHTIELENAHDIPEECINQAVLLVRRHVELKYVDSIWFGDHSLCIELVGEHGRQERSLLLTFPVEREN